MNIQKAVKEAVKIGGYIARREWAGALQLQPMDSPECCICSAKGRAPCPRWQPGAKDLMAEDWEVTTEEWF